MLAFNQSLEATVMVAKTKTTKSRKNNSREKQSEFLKDKLDGTDLSGDGSNQQVTISSYNLVNQAKQEHLEEKLQIKKIRDGLIVEQNVTYTPGPKKPIMHMYCRLSTAVRGVRKSDGLIERAFLLRLELLKLSPNLKVAGFQLGPWQATDLDMDIGSIFLTPPLWTGFKADAGAIAGRLLLKDLNRHRMIDIPWKTNVVMPGVEPITS